MAFIPYVNNRLELLADDFCEVLQSSPNESAFEKDCIIVQTRGMEQWLKYRIAETNGIASLLEFPFPEVFLEKFFPQQNQEESGSSYSTAETKFSREVLTWAVMRELPQLIAADKESGRNLFISLRKYLSSDEKTYSEKYDIKLLQLSEKIAELFYKYLAYRPDCLLYWEGNSELRFNVPKEFQENSWQKKLWIKVSGRLGANYLARRVYESVNNCRLSTTTANSPIKRVFIFGITTMPPFYLEIFIELSKYIDVHFFYRNICRDNWEHNYSEKELFKYFSDSKGNLEMPDTGNELLGSLAHREREFFSLLVSKGFVDHENNNEDSSLQKNITLLSSIRDDILNMTEPKSTKSVCNDDDSIQFHSFHSPMREIESLHNYLLKVMDESNGSIKPKDIIVITPDIQKYAPFIEAVFESKEHDKNYIYSTISDRNIRETNIEAEAYLSLLELVNSRFKVTDVLALLLTKTVLNSFGLKEEDMELIHKWLKECAVNWGIDAKNRQDMLHSENTFYENSWKAGLDRMILGYAMTSADRDIGEVLYRDFNNAEILPYEEVEGTKSAVLGKFIHFMEELFELNKTFSSEMTPEEWRDKLSKTIDIFFSGGTDITDSIDILYHSVNSMFNDISSAEFNNKIGIDVVYSYLGKHLQEKFTFHPFLRGGVSFCRFTPMRSIPAKVICMIGMNDDAFPRKESKVGFDLMRCHKRRCDPSEKNEDRYMFLEALVSASDKLYVSYIGRSITDNSEQPSSVVVSELKEYIDRNYRLAHVQKQNNLSKLGRKSLPQSEHSIFCNKDGLVYLSIEHPLHGFSSKYFTTTSNTDKHSHLFNYSKEDCNIARLLNTSATEKKQHLLDFGEKLPEIEDKAITIENFVEFFQNPSRWLLRNRLDTNLDIYLKEELNDKEIIELDNLETYNLNQELLSFVDFDSDLIEEDILNLLKAEGHVSPGKWGETEAVKRIREVVKFKDGLKGYVGDKKSTVNSENICNIHKEFVLYPGFSNLYKKGQVFYRFGRERAVDLIKTWIYHVALCILEKHTTCLITWDKKNAIHNVTTFEILENKNARRIMKDLFRLYDSGTNTPLPFFPESSLAYVNRFLKKGNSVAAHSAALKKWKPDDFYSGKSECEDYYFRACFGEVLPSSEYIEEPALLFYKPLLKSFGGGSSV
jgi:exodeoxyribonuclease V gamma subunit